VGKTALIHQLAAPQFGQYFLVRPRRFGKSLLISTLKAILRGRQELFDLRSGTVGRYSAAVSNRISDHKKNSCDNFCQRSTPKLQVAVAAPDARK
jgi:hypothetical protein